MCFSPLKVDFYLLWYHLSVDLRLTFLVPFKRDGLLEYTYLLFTNIILVHIITLKYGWYSKIKII